MLSPRNPLLESALRPFRDNAELELAASELLSRLVKADSTQTVRAIARWKAVDQVVYRYGWRAMLWFVGVVVSCVMFLNNYQEIGRYVVWRHWIGGEMIFTALPGPATQFLDNLTPEQRLLFGASPHLSRRAALWESAPDNPAYFVEWVLGYVSEFEVLPPDYLATARRLDPENAWFTWFAAAVEAKGAVKTKAVKHLSPDKTTRTLDTWEILDQARLDRATALIQEAQLQPKFVNYANEMLHQREKLVPVVTLVDYMDYVSSVASASSYSDLRLISVAHLLSAQSCLAAEAGDVAGFKNTCQTGERLIRLLAESEATSLMAGLAGKLYISSISKSFAESAEKLSLEQDSRRWRGLLDAMTARKTKSQSNVFQVAGKSADPKLVAGTLFGNFLELGPRLLATPLPVSDADLEPGRMLDHEVLSRFCGYVGWVLLGISWSLVIGYRARVTALGRRLAKRIEQLLDFRDWVWILGVGIVLPLFYVMVINRLTPLGGRHYGMCGNALLLPAGHFLGLIMLWWVVPSQIGSWRLARRMTFLGFPGVVRTGWIATGAAVAWVPLVGWAGITQSFPPFWEDWMMSLNIDLSFEGETGGPWRWWLAVAAAAVPVLWLGSCLCRALFTSAPRSVRYAISARILEKTLLGAMILIALATMGFKESEKFWVRRDTMHGYHSAQSGVSRYEDRIAQGIKQELRVLLGRSGD